MLEFVDRLLALRTGAQAYGQTDEVERIDQALAGDLEAMAWACGVLLEQDRQDDAMACAYELSLADDGWR